MAELIGRASEIIRPAIICERCRQATACSFIIQEKKKLWLAWRKSVLFYHSGKEKAVVGLAEVVKGAYVDPTAADGQWVAVDLKPVRALKTPVPLAAIRYDKRLSQLPLIRQSQLSVMSLSKDEFDIIVATGDGKTRKK